MSYYIGLSLIKEAGGKKSASAEARRILSLFEGRPVEENDIARTEQGRPFFPDRELDFSIAHTGARPGSLALVAVSLARGGNLRTGCDIERINKRSGTQEMAETYFSASEKSYIFNRKSMDEARFYKIWTLKECFLKLRGLSVFNMPAVPSFISEKGSSEGEKLIFCAAVSSALSFRLYELSDSSGDRYILATALEGAQQTLPAIQWFSQSTLDCKIIAEIKAMPSPAETVSPKR